MRGIQCQGQPKWQPYAFDYTCQNHCVLFNQFPEAVSIVRVHYIHALDTMKSLTREQPSHYKRASSMSTFDHQKQVRTPRAIAAETVIKEWTAFRRSSYNSESVSVNALHLYRTLGRRKASTSNSLVVAASRRYGEDLHVA